jgi:branched-subunit amino acid transport protein
MTALLLIFGMTAVTYIPRLLPLVILTDLKLPYRFKVFLRMIPPAALGALIFPDVFTVMPEKPLVTSMVLLTAACTAALWKNLIISVFSSLAVAVLLSLAL